MESPPYFQDMRGISRRSDCNSQKGSSEHLQRTARRARSKQSGKSSEITHRLIICTQLRKEKKKGSRPIYFYVAEVIDRDAVAHIKRCASPRQVKQSRTPRTSAKIGFSCYFSLVRLPAMQMQPNPRAPSSVRAGCCPGRGGGYSTPQSLLAGLTALRTISICQYLLQ